MNVSISINRLCLFSDESEAPYSEGGTPTPHLPDSLLYPIDTSMNARQLVDRMECSALLRSARSGQESFGG